MNEHVERICGPGQGGERERQKQAGTAEIKMDRMTTNHTKPDKHKPRHKACPAHPKDSQWSSGLDCGGSSRVKRRLIIPDPLVHYLSPMDSGTVILEYAHVIRYIIGPNSFVS